MKPAFILRNIAVVNFYLYGQDFPIDDRGNTVFLGNNGSGKSVLLDAIQIVMTGMNGRYLDLNSRVSEGGKNTRTVREACLGLLDDGAGFERESCITYIALGFESTADQKRCTAGVCIEAKNSLSEENVLGLFVAEDVILRFSDFAQELKHGYEEKPWQDFLDEQRRKKVSIQTFPRQNNRAFLRQLYATINANARGTQLDPDRARAAMRQALSFDIEDIKSVTDFVRRFLLEEAKIEVETFQARYTIWRNMQRDIARVEAEIGVVESIRGQCDRVMLDQFNSHLWSYGEHRAEYDRYTSVIAAQRREVEEIREQLESVVAYRRTLADNIDGIREHLNSVKRQIDGTPAYKEIEKAQAEKERQTAQRRNGAIEAKPALDALSALRQAVDSPILASFVEIVAFGRDHLSAAAIGVYGPDWPAHPAELAGLISRVPLLEAAKSHVDSAFREAATQRAQLAKELDDTDRHLANLARGGTMMSSDARDFLDNLVRTAVQASTLSELTDISPAFSEWRGIIEAILGDWCDAVTVEPHFMDKAYALFDNQYKATRAKLVQTEVTSAADQATRSGTLAEAVVTENPHARAFINARLGRIVRAQSARDIRKGDLAASADGKYAHGRGIEYRRLPQIPRLGKSVRDSQVAQLTALRGPLERRHRLAQEDETRKRALLEALRRADETLVVNRNAILVIVQRIQTADSEIARQEELITQLEAALPEGLLDKKKWLEGELKRYQTEEKGEEDKEKDLIEKRGGKLSAIEGNIGERRKSAQKALDAIPPFSLRNPRRDKHIGLELFFRRARVAYAAERAAKPHLAILRNSFADLTKARSQSQRGAATRLITMVQDYVLANPDQHPGFEWTRIVHDEQTPALYDWISLRHRQLTENVLRDFKAQVDKAVAALVETMVHDFLARLRANIEVVDRTKEELNRALRHNIFMGEVYQVRSEREQDKDAVRYLIDRLDIVAPKATALMQSVADPNDPDQIRIIELIDMLTVENGDDAANRKRLRELSDYRSYFRFNIDICDPNKGFRKISDLEQRRGKASGGQKFVPFYICLGVASSAAYFGHLGDRKDASPQSALLLMDEAFEKLDPDNIYKIVSFYKDLGLQLIMAAPKTHQALYQETFNTLISIVRAGRAIQATVQHIHGPAHDILRRENPMHKPRSYFEELVNREREDAAE